MRNQSSQGDNRPALFVVCNSLAYFNDHKAALFKSMEKDYKLELFAGEASTASAPPGFELHPIPLSRYRHFEFSDLVAFWKLFTRMRKEKPPKAVSFTLKANLLTAATCTLNRFTGGPEVTPVIVNPGLGRVFDPSNNSGLEKLRLQFVSQTLRVLLRLSKATAVFENPDDRQRWIEEKIVDPAKAKVKNGTGVEVPASVPVKTLPPPLKVVFAGRMIRAKGVHEFINAARKLEYDTNIVFEMYGAATKRDKDGIAVSDEQLPTNLTYHGPVSSSDMEKVLQSAHCVCLPTAYMEGMPRILLEGAVAKCALIATNIPGCREIVQHQKTGLLLESNSEAPLDEQLAEAIRSLANDPGLAGDLGESARRRIIEGRFDLESVRSDFQEMIENA